MYVVLVIVHSWLRWLLLLAALNALGRAIGGASSGRPWAAGDSRAGKWLVILFDAQFLIGLFLYVALSPLTQTAFADFGAAMRQPDLRFWAVEHIAGMLVASALLHIGRKRTQTLPERSRHKAAAIFFGLSLLVVLLSIPWPGMPAGRPLFRGF
jgi:hypothetical protein